MNTVVVLAVVAAAVTAAAGVAVWRVRALKRALRQQQGSARLMGGVHHRDMQAFKARLQEACADRAAGDRLLDEAAVLNAADAVLTAELARTTRPHPQEGDTP
ncbi:hypothetical protein ACWCPT_29775 [Streptomyces sp. NPDC002308]